MMGWPQFLAWAATQGFKHTRFLKQAYSQFLATRKWPGKEVILKKAKNLYDKFIAKVPTKKIAEKIRKDIKKDKLPIPKKEVVNIGDRIIKKMQKQGKKVNFDDILRIYRKKPSNLKADGGRIDKALPGRSRDI